MFELGESAWYVTARNFLNQNKYPKDKVVNNFKKWINDRDEDGASESQIRAWENCYEVLHAVLRQLTEEQRRFYLVFEYVLPVHDPASSRFVGENHCRADVTLVSRDTVFVLEFKDRDDSFEGLFRAAEKYQRRFENYHVESRGMKIESMLVQTTAHDLLDAQPGFSGALIPTCSPDHLAEEIRKRMGEHPQYPNITRWIESEFHR